MVYDDDTGRRMSFDIDPEDRLYGEIIHVAERNPHWSARDIAGYLWQEYRMQVSVDLVDLVLRQRY